MSGGIELIIPRSIFGSGFLNTTNNDVRFGGLYSSTTWTPVEANQSITVQFAFNIKRLGVRIQTFSKDVDPDITFRDDGVDVITITPTGSGITESIESTVAVAAGSVCAFKEDTSGSTAGSIVIRTWKLEYERT